MSNLTQDDQTAIRAANSIGRFVYKMASDARQKHYTYEVAKRILLREENLIKTLEGFLANDPTAERNATKIVDIYRKNLDQYKHVRIREMLTCVKCNGPVAD